MEMKNICGKIPVELLRGLAGGGADEVLSLQLVGFVVHAGGPQGRPRSVHQIMIGDGHTVPPNQKSNGIAAWDHQASAPFSWGRTSFRAWIATSSMESSGSKVVKFCIQRPGAARIFVNQLSWAPTKWLIS